MHGSSQRRSAASDGTVDRRVVHATNLPTPYRVAICNEIDRQLAQRRTGYEVYFSNISAYRRRWHEPLAAARFAYSQRSGPTEQRRPSTFGARCRSLWSALRKARPDVIVTSSMGFEGSLVLLYRLLTRARVVVHSGAIRGRRGDGRDSLTFRVKERARFLLRRWWFRPLTTAWVAYGSRSRDYLLGLGVRSDRIFIGQNTVDVAPFEAVAGRTSPKEEDTSVMAAGAPERPVRLVCIGRMTRLKGLDLLLDALDALPGGSVRLTCIGERPQDPQLQARASDAGFEVEFTGFLDREQLPERLVAADVFVFPTRFDVFGLAMVEAAAAGLPIVASCFAGGVGDIVVDGENGFVVDPRDRSALAAAIERLVVDPDLRERMSRRSKARVEERFRVSTSASGFVEAIEFACGKRVESL